MSLEQFARPTPVTDAELAFGPRNINDLLPQREDLPEWTHNGSHWARRVVDEWFFKGVGDASNFYPRKGIDAELAFRHLRSCIGSWAPQHERKQEGCAYLINLWFEKVEMNGNVYEAYP